MIYKLILHNIGYDGKYIPFTLYSEEKLTNEFEKSVEVYFDGKKTSRYIVWSRKIYIKYIPEGIRSIQIKYTYKTEDVIQQFNNATVLRLNNDTDKFFKTNYEITLPSSSNIFETNSKKVRVNKIFNNKYSLELPKKISADYIDVKIDKGIIKRGKEINENIEMHHFMKLFNNDKIENFITIGICGILTLIVFFVVIILTRKIKVTEYIRDPERLLEPIIAESIIDRKIGTKELIMSCIVELIYRKKLRNIGNDAIEIINLTQISDYEKEIIDLIFNGKTRITFNDIKTIFLEEAEATKFFYEKFINIKRKIEKKIYDYNIYSRIGDKILKIIKYFSFSIIIIMGYLLFNTLFEYDIWSYGVYATVFVLFFISISGKIPKKGKEAGVLSSLILFLFSIIIFLIFRFKEHLIMITGVLIITIINAIIIKRTNLHIFTKKGKQEYAKVVGLKKYILDYSLMEERDLESVIIWDEYLAYSVAFGISNKVSRRFSENLLEANIIIQRIDNLL